ncbi:hypothetical protein SISNIDRAFT_469446 [Sistotremastrum niveocremeum HHB9708]|uniref:SUN domain-containing protein n=1 Tax=Sistotremastrum niveocremeum HHB9708 TaxID=1314777 RepID=A0A164Q8G9_9AGAM|nr:hypothetical protein SISNIDRAFT_469446 [Sistotremastrum niveocremeum HHB9708]
MAHQTQTHNFRTSRWDTTTRETETGNANLWKLAVLGHNTDFQAIDESEDDADEELSSTEASVKRHRKAHSSWTRATWIASLSILANHLPAPLSSERCEFLLAQVEARLNILEDRSVSHFEHALMLDEKDLRWANIEDQVTRADSKMDDLERSLLHLDRTAIQLAAAQESIAQDLQSLGNALNHQDLEIQTRLASLNYTVHMDLQSAAVTTPAVNQCENTCRPHLDLDAPALAPQTMQTPSPENPSSRSPDFALYSGGGRVWHDVTSPSCKLGIASSSGWKRFATSLAKSSAFSDPEWALHSHSNLGTCWAHVGSLGQIGIELMRPISITGITIEHPLEVRVDPSSTPREMLLVGLVDDGSEVEKVRHYWAEYKRSDFQTTALRFLTIQPKARGAELVVLSSFTYDLHAHTDVQTFLVDPQIRQLRLVVRRVIVITMSNWGNDNHTLICRIRVHGDYQQST